MSLGGFSHNFDLDPSFWVFFERHTKATWKYRCPLQLGKSSVDNSLRFSSCTFVWYKRHCTWCEFIKLNELFLRVGVAVVSP